MYFRPINLDETGTRDASPIETDVANGDLDGVKIYDSSSGKSISIRLATTHGHRDAAQRLLNRRYSWRGYGDNHTIADSSSHTTFSASSEDEVLGTITLAVDSSKGLAVDTLFKDTIDEFRSRPGASVCELTKFAIDAVSSSKPVLASLFHLIFIYGSREYGCTDLFIEVNPRHSRFYELLLGFKPIGEVKTNESVAAPSQLMWLSVAEISEKVREYAGASFSKSRSLYCYFFLPKDEEGLYHQLLASRPAAEEAMPTKRFARMGGAAGSPNAKAQSIGAGAFRTGGRRATTVPPASEAYC